MKKQNRNLWFLKMSIVLVFSMTCTQSNAQIISKFAGSGTHGFSGMGGPATAAELGMAFYGHQRTGVSIDGLGNLYFMSGTNFYDSDFTDGIYHLLKVNDSGIISIVGGDGTRGLSIVPPYPYNGDGGPATATGLYNIEDVAADRHGNVFLMSTALSVIRKIDASGVITTYAGNGYDSAYTGSYTDGIPATDAHLKEPKGIAVDTFGNLYISDRTVVRMVNTSGIIYTVAGTGTFGFSGDGGPATTAELNHTGALTVDAHGNLFIATIDSFFNVSRIRKVNSSGIITTFAGNGTSGSSGDGGPATAAGLPWVQGLAIDDCGNVFLSGDYSVRKVDGSGIITLYAGTGYPGVSSGDGGPALAAILDFPTGLAVDNCKNLYFNDFSGASIRMVNKIPPITGIDTICVGSTTTLSNIGVCNVSFAWYSSDTSIATVDFVTGIVTGVAPGTVTISYVTSCFVSTFPMTVNTLTGPTGITGTTSVCVSATTTLSNIIGGGVWSSSSSGIATVGSGSGVVSGVTDGSAYIFYTLANGCRAMAITTVYATPASITGIRTVCVGQTTILNDASVGGTWSSSNGAIATVGSNTGIVTGISFGTCTITYTNLCGYTTTSVTVDAPVSSITGTMNVCPGATTTLYCGTAGGTWTVASPYIATVNPATGVVTGVNAGTTTITYSLSTACYIIATFTVNPPAAIIGPSTVCAVSTILLSDATTGGTWSSSDASVASVLSSGNVTGVSAGTATITYAITSTGCFVTKPIAVNPIPSPIYTSGSSSVCVGSSITFTDTTTGGFWSATPVLVGTIGAATGIFTGLSGTSTATIAYTLLTGCYVTALVSVNAAPLPITGPTSVCVDFTITLADSVPGGIWTVTPGVNGSIDPATGILTGLAVGPDTVVYTSSAGCGTVTYPITVNALPASIFTSGILPVCPGSSITFTNSTPGGSWSATPITVGTIASGTGVFTGVSGPATATVTYSLTTGCYTTFSTASVYPTPGPITGPASVCIGDTISLANSVPGGTWQMVPGLNSIVDLTTGEVIGLTVGTDTVTYSFSTGCGTATHPITINPLPVLRNVMGGGTYCSGGIGILVGLNGSNSGINYQLFLGGTPVGTPVAGTGTNINFGRQTVAGTYTVIATNSVTGCSRTMNGSAAVSIDPLPNPYPMTGGGINCTGGGTHVGLSSSDTGISYQLFVDGSATDTPIAGTGSPLGFGLQTTEGIYTVIATNTTTGCSDTMTGSVTVFSLTAVRVDETLPTAITGDATYTYNPGSSGFTLAAVPLPSLITGVTYGWDDGSSPVSGPTFSPTYTSGSTVAIHYYTVTAVHTSCTVTATVEVVVPPTGCTPYDYFSVNGYRNFDDSLPPITCTNCDSVQPFHTITASTLIPFPLTSANIYPNENYYIVNDATLTAGTYSGDNFFMNGGVTLEVGMAADTIIACHFSSSPTCMWRGIDIDVSDSTTGPGTGAGSLTILGSLIENAGDGMTAGINIHKLGTGTHGGYFTSPMPYILISDSTIYNSNYCGILIDGYAPTTADTALPTDPHTPLPIKITNSIFTHRDFTDYIPTYGGGGTSADYYPFYWPPTIALKAFTPDPADPTFSTMDEYRTRTYTTSTPAGHVGIYLLDCGYSYLVSGVTSSSANKYKYSYLQVGDTSADVSFTNTNVFDNMFFGVQILNSNVLFNNNTFRRVSQGIEMSNQYNDVQLTGNQYTSSSSSPYYTGDNSNNRFFSNKQLGFSVQSASSTFMIVPNDLTCNNALFTSSKIYGNIAIDMNFLSPAYPSPAFHNVHNINNNIIYNYSKGVNIYHQTGSTTDSAYSGVTNINNNLITGKPDTGGTSAAVYCGIAYSDIRVYSGSHGNGIVNINSNRLVGVENGIAFNSWIDSAYVNSDTVILADYSADTIPPTGMVWGIYVYQSPFLQEVKSNISGAWGYGCNTTNPGTSGIFATIGIFTADIGSVHLPGKVDMSCNAVHDIVRGFNFQGSNYVNWFNNEMVRDSIGMFLDGGGKIHQQGDSSTPSDNHWEGSSGSCSYCSATCSTSWPGWVAASGIYKTYVGTSSNADSSFLWFRDDPSTYPSYDIDGGNGCGPFAFPYGFYANLDSITSGLSAPTGCMTTVSFKTTPGTEPDPIVRKTTTEFQEYSLYPNPSTGNLTIKQAVAADAHVNVQIYNILGQKVYSGLLQFAGGKANINVGNVAPGMYQVLLSDEKGDIWNKKIVIEKY